MRSGKDSPPTFITLLQILASVGPAIPPDLHNLDWWHVGDITSFNWWEIQEGSCSVQLGFLRNFQFSTEISKDVLAFNWKFQGVWSFQWEFPTPPRRSWRAWAQRPPQICITWTGGTSGTSPPLTRSPGSIDYDGSNNSVED